jgi:hypothetical protein
MAPTLEAVVSKYLEDRLALDQMEKDYKESIKDLVAFQVAREKYIGTLLDAQGMQNAKIKGVGTAFFHRHESVTIEDFDKLKDYIKETGKEELLNKSVNKTAVQEIMGEVDAHGARPNPAPPGVKYVSTRVVQIRRG